MENHPPHISEFVRRTEPHSKLSNVATTPRLTNACSDDTPVYHMLCGPTDLAIEYTLPLRFPRLKPIKAQAGAAAEATALYTQEMPAGSEAESGATTEPAAGVEPAAAATEPGATET